MLKDRQQAHRERGMRVGKKERADEEQVENESWWGLSQRGPSGQWSECKSPFLMLGHWTGSAPCQVT